MRKIVSKALLVALLCSVPGIAETQDEKRHEVNLSIGGAATTYRPFMQTPLVSAMYLVKFGRWTGNHWEAVLGLGESYGGFAWQYDFWLLDVLRLGAGVGVMPFLDAMPGNPIIVPMPEISLGGRILSGNLALSGSVTGNLGYGARAICGLGFLF
jgi:hypothetical protein